MESETLKDNSIKATSAIQKLYANSVRLSDKDRVLSAYMLEKTSRIAGVVLLITGSNKSHDPVCTELEQSAVRLVSYAAHSRESPENRTSFLSEISTLVTLLDMGVRASRVAQSNAEVLSAELIELQIFIDACEWGEGRVFIPSEHLYLRTPRELLAPDARKMADTPHEGQVRDTDEWGTSTKETPTYGTQGQVQTDIRISPIRHHSERVQEVQKDRRATILGMLQRKDRVSVRDVANVIKDCSEKTLQRELLALVAQGVLVKEGERRWSTYRLA